MIPEYQTAPERQPIPPTTSQQDSISVRFLEHLRDSHSVAFDLWPEASYSNAPLPVKPHRADWPSPVYALRVRRRRRHRQTAAQRQPGDLLRREEASSVLTMKPNSHKHSYIPTDKSQASFDLRISPAAMAAVCPVHISAR